MKHPVPFFGLNRELEFVKTEVFKSFENIFRHGRVLQSEEVQNFEIEIAERTNNKYAVAVGSCTDALFFALKSLGVEAGDEVIVPAFSFIASASCISRLGAIPKFVDVDEWGNLDASQLDGIITPKIKAIIYVHMFGRVDDFGFKKVFDLSSKYSIPLIEDCAQAFGSEFNTGEPAGSLGEISCISFDPTKVLSAPGSGGIFLTNKENLANMAKKFRYHGKNENNEFDVIGYNSQMSSLTASTLKIKLSYEHNWRQKRREIANYYIDELVSKPLELPRVKNILNHNYHKFVIQTDRQQELLDYLHKNQIQAMIHYQKLLPENSCFGISNNNLTKYSSAKKISLSAVSIPCHAFLLDNEIEKVVTTVKNFFD